MLNVEVKVTDTDGKKVAITLRVERMESGSDVYTMLNEKTVMTGGDVGQVSLLPGQRLVVGEKANEVEAVYNAEQAAAMTPAAYAGDKVVQPEPKEPPMPPSKYPPAGTRPTEPVSPSKVEPPRPGAPQPPQQTQHPQPPKKDEPLPHGRGAIPTSQPSSADGMIDSKDVKDDDKGKTTTPSRK